MNWWRLSIILDRIEEVARVLFRVALTLAVGSLALLFIVVACRVMRAGW